MSLKDKIIETIANWTAPVVEKFEDIKDADGNLIRCDKMEVGGKCQMISTDGSLIELPDADYTLEDGSVISVEGGIIKNVTPAPVGEETPAEQVQPIANAEAAVDSVDKPEVEVEVEPEAPKVDETEDLKCKLATCEKDIEDIKAAVEQMAAVIGEMTNTQKEFSEIKKRFAKEKEELSATIANLQKVPAGEPIGQKPFGTELSAVKPVATEQTTKNVQNIHTAESFYNDKVDYVEMYKNMKEVTKSLKK